MGGPGTDHVILTGYGNLRAHPEGRLADNVEDAEWRPVKVKINDR